MRNPTTADFDTQTQRIIFLINLTVFRARIALTPETISYLHLPARE
jgi:hypothetical protein